jgi:hypothetical protein
MAPKSMPPTTMAEAGAEAAIPSTATAAEITLFMM